MFIIVDLCTPPTPTTQVPVETLLPVGHVCDGVRLQGKSSRGGQKSLRERNIAVTADSVAGVARSRNHLGKEGETFEEFGVELRWLRVEVDDERAAASAVGEDLQ
jgi:hypothetical protein